MLQFRNLLHSRFVYLFLVLIAYFILGPIFAEQSIDYLIISILFSIIILVSASVAIHGKKMVTVILFLAILSFGGTWSSNFLSAHNGLYLIHLSVTLLYLAFITWAVLFGVLKHETIGEDTILGAVCGYLLIGLCWSIIYLIICYHDASAFNENFLTLSPGLRRQDSIYYSFVTLTTTGYGDILPHSAIARGWTWMEAIIGQIYLAVWISRLIGLQIAQRKHH